MRYLMPNRRPRRPFVGGLLAGACALLLAGCDLDVSNPNALSTDAVLLTESGLLGLAVGMQDLYAENVEVFVQAPALVTDEWGTGTRSLSSYRDLIAGDITNDLGVVEAPWAAGYRVVDAADALLENVPAVEFDGGVGTGLLALARLYKAMAYGTMILQYEEIILDPAVEPTTLSDRATVLARVLELLESARTDYAALDAGDRALLQSRVLGGGFDVGSTIDAMLARYHLFAGQYGQARTAAERVALTATSVIPYASPDQNQICALSECGLLYVFPLLSWAEEAVPGDGRPGYWADVDAEPFSGNPPELQLLPLNQYGDPGDPFWVYVPDEMTLIRAEAHARAGELELARDLINEVRTRATVEPVAGLPALPEEALDSEEELLRQIVYERRYELYEQGLRWEDLRRLGAYTEEEPSMMWLPIPLQECRNNPDISC